MDSPNYERLRVLGAKTFLERTPAEAKEYHELLNAIAKQLTGAGVLKIDP